MGGNHEDRDAVHECSLMCVQCLHACGAQCFSWKIRSIVGMYWVSSGVNTQGGIYLRLALMSVVCRLLLW